MALNLSHLAANVRELELDFAGEKLTFTYRPAKVTPAFSDALGYERQPLVWALAKAVVKWDLMDGPKGEETTVSLTEQSLMTVPIPILRAVLNRVLDDTNSGEPFAATFKTG